MDIIQQLREMEVNERLMADEEIRRLREDRDLWKGSAQQLHRDIERLRAENNLLQAAQGMLKKELMEIGQALNDPRDNLTLTTAECIAELRAENERLRAALERIADVYCPNGNLVRDIDAALRGRDAIDAAREGL